MPSCAVATCKSWGRGTTSKSGVYGPEKAHFYRFPKEKKLRAEWIRRCHRGDQFNVLNARVCSDHFKKEDFARDLKAELMGGKATVRLLPHAVPTLYLPEVIQDQLELEELAEAARKAAHPVPEPQPTVEVPELSPLTMAENLPDEDLVDSAETNLTDESLSFFRRRIAEYEGKIGGLKKEVKCAKNMAKYHRERCEKLKSKNHSLLKQILDTKRQLGVQKKVNEKLERALDAFTAPHARTRLRDTNKKNIVNNNYNNSTENNNVFVFEGNFRDLNCEQILTAMRDPLLIM